MTCDVSLWIEFAKELSDTTSESIVYAMQHGAGTSDNGVKVQGQEGGWGGCSSWKQEPRQKKSGGRGFNFKNLARNQTIFQHKFANTSNTTSTNACTRPHAAAHSHLDVADDLARLVLDELHANLFGKR